jgi:hypothetical protein
VFEDLILGIYYAPYLVHAKDNMDMMLYDLWKEEIWLIKSSSSSKGYR